MDSLTTRFQKEVFRPYVELLQAQYRFHPTFEQFRRQWTANLDMRQLVNGPYLEKSQIYKRGEALESLELHEKTVATVSKKLNGRPLYKHQTDALRLILDGKNAVIATGTSSGKTLCFQVPILDDLLRDPSPGLRAIIIYPLNALVNDQLNDWEELLRAHPQIMFARFTGQTPRDDDEYQINLRLSLEAELREGETNPQALQRKIDRAFKARLEKDATTPNHLRHRKEIRRRPPHILITNFSMLEYLLVRPVDAPIFENARLKFIVLDEAHAYRGVQATEIGFLLRRLKDRLGVERAVCVATSATLGVKGDPVSEEKVRQFASGIFGEPFSSPNPIYGVTQIPEPLKPEITPAPVAYIEAANAVRANQSACKFLNPEWSGNDLAELLRHDTNLHRLRRDVLTKPMLVETAARQLWPKEPQATQCLEALLELIGSETSGNQSDDLLPTRLHYFVRAQDGLHICLRKDCPGRVNGLALVFPSRKSDDETDEGMCPQCAKAGRQSKLVELVTCRKCGYIYGALQDLGPRRKRDQQQGLLVPEPQFDSFSTELGWASDSFWSYFSTEDELPYPSQPKDDDGDEADLILNPASVQWCASCGKRIAATNGDVCQCPDQHAREIRVFHRQCPSDGTTASLQNLGSEEKRLLNCCPNCGARNGSGLEPVRRFQESEDETGTAMAIPLGHFDVSPWITKERFKIRKLLCFTDHRQRAAAFPSLLEEETFGYDMGREIVRALREDENTPVESLGERLAEIADPNAEAYNPEFFLPVSRFPDVGDTRFGEKEKRNLWKAEALAYFAVPDAARESAEDLGLVTVRYNIENADAAEFAMLMTEHGLNRQEADALLQTLLGFLRQHKAFTMPEGVRPNAVAFGSVTAEIFYRLRREGEKNVRGWLPSRPRAEGGFYDNVISDYLRRVLQKPQPDTLRVAEQIWDFLQSSALLKQRPVGVQLFSDLFIAEQARSRYVCNRCRYVTTYSARGCCPRKECTGQLESKLFESTAENIVARWVSADDAVKFCTLNSEEHTAQINKTVAAQIEEKFRNEGINLLSSSTTFEMGINIGDLQKILLRNAPPTSASYVQRVGRAGRGSDKNAVCVTLCRGTKYDLDAWKEPDRLMSGIVRPPTVFLENEIIAQRHFNAVVFAAFLRGIVQGGQIQQPSQTIPLTGFLPILSRKGVPQNWLRGIPPDTFFDFPTTTATQSETSFFQTPKGLAMVQTLGGFDEAKRRCLKGRDDRDRQGYEAIMSDITDELEALMKERTELFSQGRPTGDIDQSLQKLLSSDIIQTLAKRGFLPRYAFPLDVVTLETKRTRWDESDVELSRDRAVAISEFAPSAQVIARKKVFTSAGLYITGKSDRPEREWYSVCPTCRQIRTALRKEGIPSPCPACNRPVSENNKHKFVQPIALSISFDDDGSPTKFRKNSLVRQRQSLTHFIDTVSEQDFRSEGAFALALKRDGLLFRYNLGPENKGFMLCPACGRSRPMRGFRNAAHRPLRAFSGQTGNCACVNVYTDVAFGHTFRSHCLIARPISYPQSVESLAFALQKGLCAKLELDSPDIGVAWRYAGDRQGAPPVEIVLYDRAPGGAGFVMDCFEPGVWPSVVAQARQLCANCECERACYNCLKDYGNQSHHESLDRNTVTIFLAACEA